MFLSEQLVQLTPTDLNNCVRFMPLAVRMLLMRNPARMFVAGGYIRSTIAREPVNDIDILVGYPALAHSGAAELVSHARPSNANGAATFVTTANAITVICMDPPAQLVHRWTFDTPHEAVASFDFTIACAAIWHDGTKWCSVCHADFYADLAAKRLTYLSPAREEEPGGSMLRVLKFYQRGYRIPLDSLAAVIARITSKVHNSGLTQTEEDRARVIRGLLYEVDPMADPSKAHHIATQPDDQRAHS